MIRSSISTGLPDLCVIEYVSALPGKRKTDVEDKRSDEGTPDLRQYGKINLLPPLGLSCVAAATQSAGHEAMVLDLMAEGDSESLIRTTIASFGPDVIGISIRTSTTRPRDGRFLLDEVRWSSKIAVAFPPPPSSWGSGLQHLSGERADLSKADMGIQGRERSPFHPDRSACAQSRPLRNARPVHEGLGLQGERQYAINLDSRPFPGPMNSSSPGPGTVASISDETRLPDGLQLLFHGDHRGGARFGKRSPEVVVAELAHCVGGGFRKIFFVDNTFNIPSDYAKEICRKSSTAAWISAGGVSSTPERSTRN